MMDDEFLMITYLGWHFNKKTNTPVGSRGNSVGSRGNSLGTQWEYSGSMVGVDRELLRSRYGVG